MSAVDPLEAPKLYANIMEEIKIRIAAIDLGTGGKLPLLAPVFVTEFSFLQLRMICELIALGCLVAHGNLKQSKKLKKEWAADKIIEEMEKLHLDFFPRPVRYTQIKEGFRFDLVPGRLTKEGLIELYHECGNHLHRGNVKKLLKAKMPVQVHFPEITARAQKLHDLLAQHVVSTIGNEKHFICVLRNANNNMQAQVTIAEKTKEPPELIKQAFDALNK